MNTVDQILKDFSTYLDSAWESMSSIAAGAKESEDIRLDWFQASWEILVESKLKEELGYHLFLQEYGEGGECNGASGRVWKPEAPTTHFVECIPLDASKDEVEDSVTKSLIQTRGLRFYEFVLSDGEGWETKAPFNSVLLHSENLEPHVVRLEDIQFVLREESSD